MPFIWNFPFFSIVIPLSCGVICLLLEKKAAGILTFLCLTLLTAMSGMLLVFTLELGDSFTYILGHFPSPFANEIRSGPLEALMALLLCIINLLSVTGAKRNTEIDIPDVKKRYYYLMLNILTGAMLAMIYTNDIFTAFVFLEISTIAVCAIILVKPGGYTMSSTIVYLVISLISSCLILFSIAMIYGVTGHLLLPGIRSGVEALALTGEYMLPLFVFAGLITAGLMIKSALFPFHNWLPNAYTSATTASSSIMSGFVTKSYLFLFIKLVYRLFGMEIMGMLGIPHLLIALGIMSIIYGSIKALGLRNSKRMLSYASIVQVGCICITIGLNTEAAMTAVIFHIIVHGIGKALLFTAAGGLSAVSEHRNDYNYLQGAARRDPLSAAALIVGVLSLVGIPPFPGFFSKIYFTRAAIETPFAVLTIFAVIILSTVLSAMYFFPLIGCIFSKAGMYPEMEKKAVPFSYKAVLIVFIVITLLLSLFSQSILGINEKGLAVFG